MFRVFGYLPAHSHHLRQETAVTVVTDRCLSRVDAASSRVVFEKKKSMIGGAGGLAGVHLCLVGLQVLEEGSVSSSPAPAAVP